MPNIYYDPRPVHTDDAFVPLSANGYLHFFEAGTSAYKAIYADVGLIHELDNPLALDSLGQAPVIFYGGGKYDIVCSVLTNLTTTTPLYPDDYLDIWQANDVEGNTNITVSPTTAVTYVTLNSDVRGIDVLESTLAYSYGAHTSTDGFGGWYVYKNLETTADDGGWYFQPNGGGAGRWVRLANDISCVNLGIWDLTPGSEIIDSKFSSASVVAENYGLPLRIPPGHWYWNGPTTIINANCKTIISPNVKFSQTSTGTITFSGQLEVEAITPLIHSSSSSGLYFSTSSELSAVDVRWYKGTSEAALAGTTTGQCMIMRVATTVDAAAVSDFASGLIVDSGCTTITIPDDATLAISSSLHVSGIARRIFTESGVDPSSNRVVITHLTSHAQAWWWGFGYLAGNDQGLAFKRALSCSQYAGAQLDVLTLAHTVTGIYSDTTAYAATSVPTMVNFIGGPVNVHTGGIIRNINVGNSPYDQAFNMLGGQVLNLHNSSVSPQWFGATGDGITDDTDAIENAVLSVASSATSAVRWVDGHDFTYLVSELSVTNTYFGIRNATFYSSTADTPVLTITSCSTVKINDVNLYADTANVYLHVSGSFSIVVDGGTWSKATDSNPVKMLTDSSSAYIEIKNVGITLQNATEPDGPSISSSNVSIHDNTISATTQGWFTIGSAVGAGDHYGVYDNQFTNVAIAITATSYVDVHDNDFWGSAIYNGILLKPMSASINPTSLLVRHNRLHPVAGDTTSKNYFFVDYTTAGGTFASSTSLGMCVGENDSTLDGGFKTSSTGVSLSHKCWTTYAKGTIVDVNYINDDLWTKSYWFGGAPISSAAHAVNTSYNGVGSPGAYIFWAPYLFGAPNRQVIFFADELKAPTEGGHARGNIFWEVSTSPILP